MKKMNEVKRMNEIDGRLTAIRKVIETRGKYLLFI
jgi:DNA-binding FrmR family transcriptional regulator